MASRFLVLGAGLMGRAVAYDLARTDGEDEVIIADVSEERCHEALALTASPLASTLNLDVDDHDAVVSSMEGMDVAISCVPYRYNCELARAAIGAGCHFCDLGGNNDIVRKQLVLDNKARAADVTVIPDCGLAPGLATVIAADAVKRMDKVDELHIRVGGLPTHPRPPLDYMLLFNPVGLVNEYRERPVVIRNGEVRTVEPLDELEQIQFPEPFGTLEAFNTSGGTSTLPQTMLGKVRELDYKTIRYPGHRDKVKCMMDLGLFDEQPVVMGDGEVVPRELTEALLGRCLAFEDDDVVLLRVQAEGRLEGRERSLTYTIIDHCDREVGLSAMQRMTAFPTSIVARMLATGEISERGVTPQELVVPTARYFEELERRDVGMEITWDQY